MIRMDTSSPRAFWSALTQALLRHAKCRHGAENWDAERFGATTLTRSGRLAELVVRAVAPSFLRHGYAIVPASDSAEAFANTVGVHGEGLSRLYCLLADEYSRRALIELLAYRILGPRHVRLWTNTPEYWGARALASSLPTTGRRVDTGGSPNVRPLLTDLHPIGFPVRLFTHPLSVAHQYIRNQYAYARTAPPVWVKPGDWVIDAGAAWGDTAIRMALDVGPQGRVCSFEFEAGSVGLMERNLQMNSTLAERVSLVSRPLWRTSGAQLAMAAHGLGTYVTESSADSVARTPPSLALDDLVADWPRVDYIKMDIEGAEVPALQGAERCLRKHRPRLAVSVYHSVSDFVAVPEFLASLDLGYAFYLDHASIHSEETVLFAV